MRRLWVRLTAFVAVVIVITVVLGIGLQALSLNRQYRQLDPTFRGELERIYDDPNLSEAARQEALQRLTVAFLGSEAGFEQFLASMSEVFVARQRLALFSTLVALAFGVTAAAFIGRTIAAPISQVSRAAKRVAAGDLSARATISTRLARVGKDSEIGNLVEDFNRMAASLERLEHERQNMIADIAHELRTPLTILQGQIDAMSYGVVPLNSEQLGKLSRQTELLSRLVKDLRTLSLAEAERLSLDVTEVDLRALASDVVGGFQDSANAKNVTLTLKAEPASVLAKLDGDRIAQVLINLLSNALRHAPEKGSVVVKLSVPGSKAVLSVTDSGEGLSEEALKHVFNRFYRAEPSRDRASGGSGLGLSISKAIVELHGGRMTAANSSKGAVFKVELPLARDRSALHSLTPIREG